MAIKIGGDIIEIQFQNSEIGSGVLLPKAGEDSTWNPGGPQTTDDDSSVDGGGDAIYVMNRVRWSLSAPIAWDFGTPSDNTLDKINALSRSKVETTFTITHINGSVYVGNGKIVGSIEGNGNNGTIPIKIAGSGNLKKIV